jgi:hypothetical protein
MLWQLKIHDIHSTFLRLMITIPVAHFYSILLVAVLPDWLYCTIIMSFWHINRIEFLELTCIGVKYIKCIEQTI